MSRDSTVIRLRQPEVIDDPLSEIAREGLLHNVHLNWEANQHME